MKHLKLCRAVKGLGFASALILSACVTKPDALYYWGDYQPQVYGHLTGEKGPDQQIAVLEAGIEKAHAVGKPLPPGYQAHLGILYAEKGQSDQMKRYFDAEKTQYPESAAYMDFLMRSKNKPAE